jgi:hypothetical protein
MLAADPRWCFEYQAKAWYGSDPWLLYASLNSEPRQASKIVAMTGQQREVQVLAQKYGMVSVCIAPAASPGANARVGMLALGSPREGFFGLKSSRCSRCWLAALPWNYTVGRLPERAGHQNAAYQ